MQVESGMLLVATAGLTEPAFMRAVIYLLEHNTNGTLGFIVNRPLDIPLSDLWDQCPAELHQIRIAAEGGPVDRDQGLLLHGCRGIPGAQPMGTGVLIGGDVAALAERYAGGTDSTGPRLFLGHSGWAPGQLDRELRDGSWLLRPGRPELLLTQHPTGDLWRQLLDGGSGLPSPSLN